MSTVQQLTSMQKLNAAASVFQSDAYGQIYVTLDRFMTPTPAHEKIVKQIRAGLDARCPWWLLIGPPGVGKSHLGHVLPLEYIIRHADANNGWGNGVKQDHADHGFWRPPTDGPDNSRVDRYIPLNGMVTTYLKLVEEIRTNPKRRQVAIREHLCPILVVDEVRKIELYDIETATIDQLFDERYRRRMFTVFISNLHEAEFWEVLGGRIGSRFLELGETVKFNLPDWRARKLAACNP